EGVAKLSDVISFLFSGGLHALLRLKDPFVRAMFSGQRVDGAAGKDDSKEAGIQKFNITWRTPTYIFGVLLVLLSLTWVNTVIVAAGASRLKIAAFPSADAHWLQITCIASAMCAIVVTFGVLLYTGVLSKPGSRVSGPAVRKSISVLGWLGVIVVAGTIMVSATEMLALLYGWPSWFVAAVQPRRFPPVALQTSSPLFILGAVLVGGLASATQALKHADGSTPKVVDCLHDWLFRIAFIYQVAAAAFLIVEAWSP